MKVLDYDAISSNDAVGVVYIDLNPLLAWDVRALRDGGGGSTALSASQGETTAVSGEDRAISGYTLVLPSVTLPLLLLLLLHELARRLRSRTYFDEFNSLYGHSSWFPLYDTLRGIRGEVNVQIKLQFFGDVNPFKESSAGVQIYGTSALPMPPGYRVAEVFGFVDVLLNEDDPEYHWSDSFRTPRYSNESRQKVGYSVDALLFALYLTHAVFGTHCSASLSHVGQSSSTTGTRSD